MIINSLILNRKQILFFLTAVSLMECQSAEKFVHTYEENFELSNKGELPPYWLETYGQQSWVVDSDGPNRFLTQKSLQNDSVQVYLHLFERNPVFNGKFKLAAHQEDSHFSWLIRYNAAGSWIRVSYFPSRNRFKLFEQEDIGRPLVILDEKDFKLTDEWNDFLIEADSNTIHFSLNDQSILSTDLATHMTFGKVGFETYKARIQLDDIEYAGNQGRPNPGVVQGEIRIPFGSDKINSKGRPFWGLHLGVLTQTDSSLLGVVGFRDHESREAEEGPPPFAFIRSVDNGLQWSNIMLEDRIWAKDVDGAYIRGLWPNFTKIGDEWVLMGYKSETGFNTAHLSNDEGETWQAKGALRLTDKLRQLHTGHPWQLDMMTMPGKLSANDYGLYYPTTRVLWHAKSAIDNWEPIYIFHPENKTWNPRSQEHQVIQASEKQLVLYSRDDGARENLPESETLVKRLSSDGGKSWSAYKQNSSKFISSKCAFNIKQDPFTGQTWMFWTYNNKEDEPTANNQPRTRLGLAVSNDSANTWQYVMDVDDWGYPSRDAEAIKYDLPAYLTKDNRFANLALWVGPRYLHLTVRRRFRHGKENIEDFCIFYTRIDKQKIIPYLEFPGTRY